MAIATRLKSLVAFACFGLFIFMNGPARGASTFSVSPSGEINFTTHAGASDTQALAIRNLTSYPLVLTLNYNGSGSTNFSTSSGLVTVPANGSQSVNLSFNPIAAGFDSATLNIVSATGDSLSIPVSGHATSLGSFQIVQGSGNIVFNTHVGTPTSSSIDIKNLTNSPLIVTPTVTGSSLFTLSAPALTIPANGSQDLTITYSPLTAGDANGRLMFTASNGDTASVGLVGHAVMPSNGNLNVANEVDFNAEVGQTECLPVMIPNPGLGTLTLTNIQVTGDTAAFSTSSSTGMMVNPGTTGSIDVCFHPVTAKGDIDGNLSFTYANSLDSTIKGTVNVQLDGHATAAPPGPPAPFFLITNQLEFNNVIVGQEECQALQIANPTSDAVTIDSATLSGSEAAEYNVSGANMLQIGANSTEYVTVCMTPMQAGGDQDATLALHYTVNGTSTTGTLNVKLNANAIDTTSPELTNCIYVRHATGVIGPIVLGGMDTSSIFLTNRTNGTVTISGATLSGGDASAFTIGNNQFPMTLQSGQEGQLLVTFNPTGMNGAPSFGSTINLTLTGNSATCGPVSIHVEGVAVPGAGGNGLRDTSTVDLGLGLTGNGSNVIAITNPNPSLNACVNDTIVFTNTTNSTMTISNVLIPTNSNITLINTSMATPITLAAGQSFNAVVQFCGNQTTGQVFDEPLFVATNQSIQPQTFQIQAVDAPSAAGVTDAAPAPTVDLGISPNPSSGDVEISITNALNSKVEVYDILGNLIASFNGSENMSWNGTDGTGSSLPSGVYIVRVSGRDLIGQQFRVSKQLVIQR